MNPGHGIRLEHCDNSLVSENTVRANGNYDGHAYHTSLTEWERIDAFGISLYDCPSGTIRNNTLGNTNNRYYGNGNRTTRILTSSYPCFDGYSGNQLFVENSDNMEIYGNLISGECEIGIVLHNSEASKFEENDIRYAMVSLKLQAGSSISGHIKNNNFYAYGTRSIPPEWDTQKYEDSYYPGYGVYVSSKSSVRDEADEILYSYGNVFSYLSESRIDVNGNVGGRGKFGATFTGMTAALLSNQNTHVIDLGELEMVVTLSEYDAEIVTDLDVFEDTGLGELSLSSGDPSAIEQLWTIAFLDELEQEVQLADSVTITLRPKESTDVLLMEAQESETEPAATLSEETCLYARNEDGVFVAVASYDAIGQDLTAIIEDASMIGLGFKAQALATNLQSLVIYPNPFRLETNTSGDQRMKLDNLTPDAHIEIFNVLGEMVLEAQITNNAGSSNNAHLSPVAGNPGRVAWDLRNAGGQRVASGVYIVVVSNSAGERVIKKVSVIW